MADASIDADAASEALDLLTKTQSVQRQRIADLQGEVARLGGENERLTHRAQLLEGLLAAHNVDLALAAATSAQSSVAATQPLSISVTPMEEVQQPARGEQKETENNSSPTQRVTRSRTRNGISHPALLRESTTSALFAELSQQTREEARAVSPAAEEGEDKDAAGRKRRKPSAGERSVEKKVKQESDGSSHASASPQQPVPLAVEVEQLLERARAEKDKGIAEFERGFRGYHLALEHYQDALELLAPHFPSPSAPQSYPGEVANLCASLHHKVGVVHNKRGDFNAACDQFDAALHWQPGWWRLWKALGYSEFARARYSQALQALEQALLCGVDERKDRADLEEKIELARSLIHRKLATPQPPARQVDTSPCRSPIPTAQPNAPHTSTTPARLVGKFDRADGRQPLGDVTNTAATTSTAPSTPASQPAKSHNNDKLLLQLPLITKESIRDLLGSETFAVAGELHENKQFLQFMAEKGGVVRGRTREIAAKKSRVVEQMCRFQADRCVEYSCNCMLGQEPNKAGEQVQKPPQERVRVNGSAEEVWRYAPCAHIGAMLLTLQGRQQALLQPPVDKENDALSMTPSKRLALASSHPTMYVTPAHRLSPAEEQRDRSLAERYSAMKSEQLSAALKANDSKSSGLKVELVARCVELELRGVPEKCSVCRWGNMYQAGGVWRCRGNYDKDRRQYVRCDHIALDWPTRPWKRV